MCAPKKAEWVSCRDRLPTEADADEFGEIYWCGKEHVRREDVTEVLSWDFKQPWNLNGFWMPTGIVRPKPPAQAGVAA